MKRFHLRNLEEDATFAEFVETTENLIAVTYSLDLKECMVFYEACIPFDYSLDAETIKEHTLPAAVVVPRETAQLTEQPQPTLFSSNQE